MACACVCSDLAEKEHSVLKRVLLEDEVLATMASVWGLQLIRSKGHLDMLQEGSLPSRAQTGLLSNTWK